MPFEEVKYRIITGLFDMAGHLISGQITQTDYDEQEKIRDEYYDKAKQVAREDEKQQIRKKKQIMYAEETEKVLQPVKEQIDLTPEKIEGGVACLPCSTDHFSTVSGALNEALRFARKEGVNHPEVMKRLGLCKDELNIMERLDLSSENITQLKGKEKQLADWGLNEARNLRHKITAIQNPDHLERVAAEASRIRTKFMRDMWSIATVDGSINKLCKGLKDDEHKRCVSTINEVLSDKKNTPL